MVSFRCILYVEQELKKLRLIYFAVDLGMAEIFEDISDELQKRIRESLKKAKLELLEKKQILVERIKSVVVKMIHLAEEIHCVNYSSYISEKLGYDYNYLSNTFTEVKETTIQQYIIQYKIERVKELLMHDELTLTEIAWKLRYSSVAHLSNQFKKITGRSPTLFKQQAGIEERKYIEEL